MVTMTDQSDFIVELSAEPRASIGYGMVYGCEVRRVLKGKLTETSILLTILASDHETEEIFAAKKAPATIEAGFRKERENEPYAMMPITGFVDARRTSWRLVYAR